MAGTTRIPLEFLGVGSEFVQRQKRALLGTHKRIILHDT